MCARMCVLGVSYTLDLRQCHWRFWINKEENSNLHHDTRPVVMLISRWRICEENLFPHICAQKNCCKVLYKLHSMPRSSYWKLTGSMVQRFMYIYMFELFNNPILNCHFKWEHKKNKSCMKKLILKIQLQNFEKDEIWGLILAGFRLTIKLE